MRQESPSNSLVGILATAFLGVLFILIVCGCPPPPPPPPVPAPVSATVGAAGGRLESPDGLRLDVAPGAVSADTTINLSLASDALPAPAGMSPVSAAVLVSASTPIRAQDKGAVTLSIPCLVPATGQAGRLIFWGFDGSEWVPLTDDVERSGDKVLVHLRGLPGSMHNPQPEAKSNRPALSASQDPNFDLSWRFQVHSSGDWAVDTSDPRFSISFIPSRTTYAYKDDVKAGLQAAWDYYAKTKFWMPDSPPAPLPSQVPITVWIYGESQSQGGHTYLWWWGGVISVAANVDSTASRRAIAAHELFHRVQGLYKFPLIEDIAWALRWYSEATANAMSGEALSPQNAPARNAYDGAPADLRQSMVAGYSLSGAPESAYGAQDFIIFLGIRDSSSAGMAPSVAPLVKRILESSDSLSLQDPVEAAMGTLYPTLGDAYVEYAWDHAYEKQVLRWPGGTAFALGATEYLKDQQPLEVTMPVFSACKVAVRPDMDTFSPPNGRLTLTFGVTARSVDERGLYAKIYPETHLGVGDGTGASVISLPQGTTTHDVDGFGTAYKSVAIVLAHAPLKRYAGSRSAVEDIGDAVVTISGRVQQEMPVVPDWQALGSGSVQVGPVFALAVYNDKLVAGGEFVTTGVYAQNLAQWNGTNWASLCQNGSGGMGNSMYWGSMVRALGVYGGELLAGGAFDSVCGQNANRVARWDGMAWAPLASGIPRLSFQWPPDPDPRSVDALATHEGQLIAGGDFVVYGWSEGWRDSEASNIARWNGAEWAAMGDTPGPVDALTTYSGELIAGGQWAGLIRWTGSDWRSWGGNRDPACIIALSVYGGELIVAGTFYALGPQLDYVASWNGTSWARLGSGTNGPVQALMVYNGDLIAGGSFTTAGGLSVNHIARWNGASWAPLGTGMNGGVCALAIYHGELIAGGSFTAAGGKPVGNIARWPGP